MRLPAISNGSDMSSKIPSARLAAVSVVATPGAMKRTRRPHTAGGAGRRRSLRSGAGRRLGAARRRHRGHCVSFTSRRWPMSIMRSVRSLVLRPRSDTPGARAGAGRARGGPSPDPPDRQGGGPSASSSSCFRLSMRKPPACFDAQARVGRERLRPPVPRHVTHVAAHGPGLRGRGRRSDTDRHRFWPSPVRTGTSSDRHQFGPRRSRSVSSAGASACANRNP